MSDKQLDKQLLFKADINILYAITETILTSMKQNGDSYNKKIYGPIDNYRTWSKPKIINWLLQFDLKLGDQIQKTSKSKVDANKEIMDIEKEKNELALEKNELALEKNELALEKENLEKERQELQQLRQQLEKTKEN